MLRKTRIVQDNADARTLEVSALTGFDHAFDCSRRDCLRFPDWHLARQTESQLDCVDCAWDCAAQARPHKAQHAWDDLCHASVVGWGLDGVVTSLAERHQVVGRMRATLCERHDVIHNGRGFNLACAQAQPAQWLASPRLLTQSLPTSRASATNTVRLPRHQSTLKSREAILTLTNDAAPMTLAQCMHTTCESSCQAPASVSASMTAFARLSMSGFLVRH